MATFNIEIQEFLARVVEVEADDVHEALSDVQNRYTKAEIVLNYRDFVEVDFIDIDSTDETYELKKLIKEVVEYNYDVEKIHYEVSGSPTDHIFLKLKRLKDLID